VTRAGVSLVRRATFPIAASRSNPKDGRNTTQRAPPAFQAKQSWP
jgi:hypothetical protein